MWITGITSCQCRPEITIIRLVTIMTSTINIFGTLQFIIAAKKDHSIPIEKKENTIYYRIRM